MRILRSLSAATTIALGLLVFCSSAWSQTTGPTREQYVQQADPICQAAFSVEPNPGKGTKRQRLARVISEEGRILETMAGQLDLIPKPVADVDLLNRWLRALHGLPVAFSYVGKGIRRNNDHLVRFAIRQLNEAQSERLEASRDYGFQDCR